MGRRARGFRLSKDERTSIYLVRFSHAGKPYKLSTGERDLERAKVEAARIYSETVSGRRGHSRVASGGGYSQRALDELFAEWLAYLEAHHPPNSVATFKMYVTAHWMPFFVAFGRMTERGIDDYTSYRLRKVIRSTVCHELSALRKFLQWAKVQKYLDVVPQVRTPGTRTLGTPHKYGNRKLVEISRDRVVALLDAMPVRTKRGHPMRAWFTVMWETSLRPVTLLRLDAPEHYRKGATHLTITRSLDKSRDARLIPLSKRARAALDEVCPKEGPIFRKVAYRKPLEKAALDAGFTREDAKHVGALAIRHGRLTDLCERTDNLAGVMALAGHKQISTTSKYVHARQRAAEAVVQMLDEDAI